MTAPDGERVVLGLRANWRQIALLVAVNAFVGGMIGLERSILPLLADAEFGISSKTAAISFIATLGWRRPSRTSSPAASPSASLVATSSWQAGCSRCRFHSC